MPGPERHWEIFLRRTPMSDSLALRCRSASEKTEKDNCNIVRQPPPSKGSRRPVRELGKLSVVRICGDLSLVHSIGNEPGLRPHADEFALSNRNVRHSATGEGKVLWFCSQSTDRLVVFHLVCMDIRSQAHGQLVVWITLGTSARVDGLDSRGVVDGGNTPANGK